MSIDPSQAPSIRANAVRLLPSLTTAMFIGTQISSARARAASTTAWAELSVTLSATLPPSIRRWGFDTIDSRDALAAKPLAAIRPKRLGIERAIGYHRRREKSSLPKT